MDALARFVSATYARDPAGEPIEAGPGTRAAEPLLRGHPPVLDLSYTCNSWVAEALHAAGCPAPWSWPVTAGGVLDQARRCGALGRMRGGPG